jgi:hypothetical protein
VGHERRQGVQQTNNNLEMEKSLSAIGVDGRKTISVSNDARWDKQSAGKRYDSLSGCSVMFLGNRSGLIVGLEPISTCCGLCEKKIPQRPDLCSHNYEGSSKGMEVTGATTLVKRLSADNTVCIGEFVSDDDASSWAVHTHSIKDLIGVGTMMKEDSPRYKNGARKPDNGQLPINHPAISFLQVHREFGPDSPGNVPVEYRIRENLPANYFSDTNNTWSIH